MVSLGASPESVLPIFKGLEPDIDVKEPLPQGVDRTFVDAGKVEVRFAFSEVGAVNLEELGVFAESHGLQLQTRIGGTIPYLAICLVYPSHELDQYARRELESPFVPGVKDIYQRIRVEPEFETALPEESQLITMLRKDLVTEGQIDGRPRLSCLGNALNIRFETDIIKDSREEGILGRLAQSFGVTATIQPYSAGYYWHFQVPYDLPTNPERNHSFAAWRGLINLVGLYLHDFKTSPLSPEIEKAFS